MPLLRGPMGGKEIILRRLLLRFCSSLRGFSKRGGSPSRTAITKQDMPPKRTWGEIGAQLATMSWDEIRTRGLQEIRKRRDTSAYRLGIDPRPVLPRGAGQPTGNFFFSTEERSQIIPLLHHRLPHVNADIIRRAEQICEHRFDLLGYRNIQYGPEIDWHLDPIHRKSAPRNPWPPQSRSCRRWVDPLQVALFNERGRCRASIFDCCQPHLDRPPPRVRSASALCPWPVRVSCGGSVESRGGGDGLERRSRPGPCASPSRPCPRPSARRRTRRQWRGRRPESAAGGG